MRDRGYGKLTGQMGIMEYLLMAFFVVVIIVVIMIFLVGWQFTQFRLEKHRGEMESTLALMKDISESPIFVKDSSMFDDAKLTALLGLGSDMCDELKKIFGKDIDEDWFVNITVFGGSGKCTAMYNSNCNNWELCKKPGGGDYTSYVIPVNIFRNTVSKGKLIGRVDIGTLEVGIYYEF